jgi:hypothetical protein
MTVSIAVIPASQECRDRVDSGVDSGFTTTHRRDQDMLFTPLEVIGLWFAALVVFVPPSECDSRAFPSSRAIRAVDQQSAFEISEGASLR